MHYAARQFRRSLVFTATAVLTLALGIGGTTAIFTLIHAVMLRSLPVKDPGRLYRVGEGDDCCVEGGPQDDWGFFSFPLYERLKSQAPEFEEVAAFQAGNWPQSVRRQSGPVARPLRSEYVTGNYFSMLGIGASSEGAYSQHGEIIPRDVLGTQGPRDRLTLSSHALRPIAGLESSHLFKLRSL